MTDSPLADSLDSEDPALPLAALAWLVTAGADEVVGDQPQDRYANTAQQIARQAPARPASPAPAGRAPQPPRDAAATRIDSDPPPLWTPEAETPQSLERVLAEAQRLATAAESLAALRDAIAAFDGCALKKTAKNTVISRGNPQAKLMLIGEAPGRDEDLQGQPFAGKAGQLLDAMLAAIELDESQVYITNMLFWRPPGDRPASAKEILLCQPFVQRQIELVAPSHLLLLGNISAKHLLAQQQNINKLRGRWRHYRHPGLPTPLAALPIYHPAFLLRQPAQKREAWRDLQTFKRVITGQEQPVISG